MIKTTDITDKTLINSYQKQAITLNTQNEITAVTTRLWVKTNKLWGMAYALTTAQ